MYSQSREDSYYIYVASDAPMIGLTTYVLEIGLNYQPSK